MRHFATIVGAILLAVLALMPGWRAAIADAFPSEWVPAAGFTVAAVAVLIALIYGRRSIAKGLQELWQGTMFYTEPADDSTLAPVPTPPQELRRHGADPKGQRPRRTSLGRMSQPVSHFRG